MGTRMGLAAPVVKMSASTVEVASPTTAVEEDAVTETTGTHQGLGPVMEDPDAVRAMDFVDIIGK